MIRQWFVIIGIAAAILLIGRYPEGSWRLQTYLRGGADTTRVVELERENAVLKAEIALRSLAAGAAGKGSMGEYRTAFVYSRYPFNFANTILVSIGEGEGVRVGNPVFVPLRNSSSSGRFPGVFLGTVREVFDGTASVQTVFDHGFTTAVRIGSEGTDALLTGGADPRVTLIPKDANINEGDVLVTASPDVPYGMPIGTIGTVSSAPHELFEEAAVVFGYTSADLRVVVIDTRDTLQ